MIAGDLGVIIGLLLILVMAGIPAVGAAKHNRQFDLEREAHKFARICDEQGNPVRSI